MQNVHFSPPELARMLSVHESTVKRWIDKGLLKATRTPGGHRRVSAEDIQQFMRTQSVARTSSYVLARAAREKDSPERSLRYYNLHVAYKKHEARTHLISLYLSLGSVREVLEAVVLPALVEIGLAWHRGDIDIADEHRMTFLMRGDLHALESLIPEPSADANTALLACVPGDNHELSLQLLSVLLKECGWRSVVLGINVPAQEVIRVACNTPIATILLTKLFHAHDTRSYVHNVRSHVPTTVPILCGGGGWQPAEQRQIAGEHNVSYVPSMLELSQTLQ